MAEKSYKQIESSETKVEEPVVAYQRVAYTPTPAKENFEERYRKARDFAYKHFDKDFIQYLETRNFLVDEPFPSDVYETEENLKRIIAESEASGECTQEEVDKMFARWESVL